MDHALYMCDILTTAGTRALRSLLQRAGLPRALQNYCTPPQQAAEKAVLPPKSPKSPKFPKSPRSSDSEKAKVCGSYGIHQCLPPSSITHIHCWTEAHVRAELQTFWHPDWQCLAVPRGRGFNYIYRKLIQPRRQSDIIISLE